MVKNSKFENEIIGDTEVASILSTTKRTLREWRRLRNLPHLKITAKEIRYRRSDILAWLDGFRQGASK